MRKGRSLAAVAGMTAALFFAQGALMARGLSHLDGWADAALLSALFALVYGGAMAAFVRIERPGRGKLAFVGAFAALAMLARVMMLDYVTADYNSFLSGWVQAFREGGFATLAENVGDYNLLYQYVLLLISKSSLHDLYLIKWFSVIFDFALAWAMMLCARKLAGSGRGTAIFCVTLALPTVLMDGACWGQCDSVYVFFIVLCLYELKDGHPARSAAALAIAFAFKLQAIFFFPVVLLALIHGEYKPRHALCFAGAYLCTMLPALCAGRSFLGALSVYASQSMGQYFDRLSYNAPNLYLFFPMLEFASSQEFTWMRYIDGIDVKAANPYLTEALMPALQNAALLACVLLTLLVVIYWLVHAREVTPDMTLPFALFFAIFLPFVMPKIHDRYFFLADLLGVLYAARRADRRFLPLLVVSASALSDQSFLTRQRPVDLRVLSLMMLAALLIVGHDLLAQMRRNRAALAQEKEESLARRDGLMEKKPPETAKATGGDAA